MSASSSRNNQPQGQNQDNNDQAYLNYIVKRLQTPKQTLDEAYAAPANFLEIEITNPLEHELDGQRFIDYEVRLQTNIPIFKHSSSSVRRRYSDFEWLRGELAKALPNVTLPLLPSKCWYRQVNTWLGYSREQTLFEPQFIEERRIGLETFINKVCCHPLVQHEYCVHVFLQEPGVINKTAYNPGKMVHC